jgi:type IV secretory pathway VirB10-like protein
MPDTEYEDSIEKFRPVNQMGPGGPGGPMIPSMQQMPGQTQQGNPQQGPQGPQGPQVPQGPQGQPSPEQIAIMQQQRAMQQQAMQQQAMQQQAMQQQTMQQQAMQQKNYASSSKKPTTFLEKLKRLKNNDTLQEIFVIAILFIIFSTSFYKNNLSKIPFVTNENNCLNTAGLLISAILIAVIFVIIRTFL